MDTPAILVLEDGTSFRGRSIGKQGIAVGEVCFHTTMTGYPEALTNPAQHGQLLALTYPHAGNVGMDSAFFESDAVQAAGLIVRDLALIASSWRSQQRVEAYLQDQGVVAICDIDTRKLTRHLRSKGTLRGCVMAGDVDAGQALAQARAAKSLEGADLVPAVTTKEPYDWRVGHWRVSDGLGEGEKRTAADLPHHVVALDLGVARRSLRSLADSGCRISVVPAGTSTNEILALQPDGLFLSSGPGDPAAYQAGITTISELLQQNLPVFGQGLGALMLAIACGASCSKLKLGHYGSNHPVIDLSDRRVMITSQNLSFKVDESSLPETVQVTHRSLFDETVQGFQCAERPVFGFLGYPEASANQADLPPIYDRFVQMIMQATLGKR